MDRIEVDTIVLKENGQDLLRLQKEYNELINSLFQRIYEVPYTTEEWVGESAIKYANYCIQEKKQYLTYGDNIKDLANILINLAEEMEQAVKMSKKEL